MSFKFKLGDIVVSRSTPAVRGIIEALYLHGFMRIRSTLDGTQYMVREVDYEAAEEEIIEMDL